MVALAELQGAVGGGGRLLVFEQLLAAFAQHFLVDAQRQQTTVLVVGEDERIAADVGRDVAARLPLAFAVDEQVAFLQADDGRRIGVVAADEGDRVVTGDQREFHQVHRDGVGFAGEREVADFTKAGFGMLAGVEQDRIAIEQSRHWQGAPLAPVG